MLGEIIFTLLLLNSLDIYNPFRFSFLFFQFVEYNQKKIMFRISPQFFIKATLENVFGHKLSNSQLCGHINANGQFFNCNLKDRMFLWSGIIFRKKQVCRLGLDMFLEISWKKSFKFSLSTQTEIQQLNILSKNKLIGVNLQVMKY